MFVWVAINKDDTSTANSDLFDNGMRVITDYAYICMPDLQAGMIAVAFYEKSDGIAGFSMRMTTEEWCRYCVVGEGLSDTKEQCYEN